MKFKLKKTIGWIFIIIGTLGFFLPFLQGFLLIAIGLVILSAFYPKLKIWIDDKFEKNKSKDYFGKKAVDFFEKVYRKAVNMVHSKK